MAIVVQHKKSKEKFVLLRTGIGMSESKEDYSAVQKKEKSFICIAKSDGSIWWVNNDEVEVFSVDGKSPANLLSR